MDRNYEEAQKLAREIARSFLNFDCDKFAKEIAKRLGRGFDAAFEKLVPADRTDVICLAERDEQIAVNGYHVGIRLGDLVFDNHHPDGVPASEWKEKFDTPFGVQMIRESRPIGDFFGKVFLAEQFSSWVSRKTK